MRNIVIVIFSFFLFTDIAIGQVEQGQLWAGINLSGNNSNRSSVSGDSESSYMNIDLNFSYLVSDNVEVGVIGGPHSSKSLQTSGNTSKSSGFEVGPYVRLYSQIGVSKIYFLSEEENISVGLSPRFSYVSDSRFRFELSMGSLSYNSNTYTDDIGLVTENRRTNNSLGMQIFNSGERSSSGGASLGVGFRLN